MERMEPGEMALTGWHVQVPGLGTPIEGGDKEEALQRGRELQPTTWKRSRQKVPMKQAVAQVAKTNKQIQGKQSPKNNARERNRVRTLRQAFLSLQAALPSVPPNTKLSKLDVLVLATSYIAHLSQTLNQERHLPAGPQTGRGPRYLHPVKKWPMRSRLYAEALDCEVSRRSAVSKD